MKFLIARRHSAKPNGWRWNAIWGVCCSMSIVLFWIKSCLEAPVTGAEEGTASSAGSSQVSVAHVPVADYCLQLGLPPFQKTDKNSGPPRENSQIFQGLSSAEEFQTCFSPHYEVLCCWRVRAVLIKPAICWSVSNRRSKQLQLSLGPGFLPRSKTCWCISPPKS